MKVDNKKSNVRHNILMRLISMEKQGSGYDHNNPIPEDIVAEIRKEAGVLTEKIYPIYLQRRDAPLWLNRQLKDPNWIMEIYES